MLAFHDSATECVGAGVPVPVSFVEPDSPLAFSNGSTWGMLGLTSKPPNLGRAIATGPNPARAKRLQLSTRRGQKNLRKSPNDRQDLKLGSTPQWKDVSEPAPGGDPDTFVLSSAVPMAYGGPNGSFNEC